MSEPREPLYKSGWLSERIAEVVTNTPEDRRPRLTGA